MAKHIIGLKRISFWVFALLFVGVYVPSLLPSNYPPEKENSYCSLEKETSPIPPRAWANKIYSRRQWVAAI
jgi:hypothetical protein